MMDDQFKVLLDLVDEVDADLGLEFTAGGFGTRVKDLEEEKGCKWVCSNFRAGDVLLFNSLTVHSDMLVGCLPESYLTDLFWQ